MLVETMFSLLNTSLAISSNSLQGFFSVSCCSMLMANGSDANNWTGFILPNRVSAMIIPASLPTVR